MILSVALDVHIIKFNVFVFLVLKRTRLCNMYEKHSKVILVHLQCIIIIVVIVIINFNIGE